MYQPQGCLSNPSVKANANAPTFGNIRNPLMRFFFAFTFNTLFWYRFSPGKTRERPCQTNAKTLIIAVFDNCGFFVSFQHNTEALKRGWIRLFCENKEKSVRCKRKLFIKTWGKRPPDNMAPTGTIFSGNVFSYFFRPVMQTEGAGWFFNLTAPGSNLDMHYCGSGRADLRLRWLAAISAISEKTASQSARNC